MLSRRLWSWIPEEALRVSQARPKLSLFYFNKDASELYYEANFFSFCTRVHRRIVHSVTDTHNCQLHGEAEGPCVSPWWTRLALQEIPTKQKCTTAKYKFSYYPETRKLFM